MKISVVKYENFDERVEIKPMSQHRKWMDESQNRYAYRCLPLNIANQHGWAVYPKQEIIAMWNGGEETDDIAIIPSTTRTASSIFKKGILTFHLPFLVRTPEEYSIFITGAPNHFIDGAYPLSGVFESDWAPYSFTMNWQLTKSKESCWTVNDPICFFFPIHRTYLEQFTLEFENFEDQEDEFKHQNDYFIKSRREFIKNKHRNPDDWQKNYFRGVLPDGQKCPVFHHRTKIKLK